MTAWVADEEVANESSEWTERWSEGSTQGPRASHRDRVGHVLRGRHSAGLSGLSPRANAVGGRSRCRVRRTLWPVDTRWCDLCSPRRLFGCGAARSHAGVPLGIVRCLVGYRQHGPGRVRCAREGHHPCDPSGLLGIRRAFNDSPGTTVTRRQTHADARSAPDAAIWKRVVANG